MLTIAPYSGEPPTLAVTRPVTVVGACALAIAGVSPSRTRPSLRVNRTNQRLSAIHFLLQLRFSGSTTGPRIEVTASCARPAGHPVTAISGFFRDVGETARPPLVTNRARLPTHETPFPYTPTGHRRLE